MAEFAALLEIIIFVELGEPEGEEWIDIGESYLKIIWEPTNWMDAEEICRQMESRLAIMDQDIVFEAVGSMNDRFIQTTDPCLWLGATRVEGTTGVYVWSNGKVVTKFWYPDEPNNLSSLQSCVGIRPSFRGLIDMNCAYIGLPLCQYTK
ncbi:hypothetical protein ScPMuIL_016158 [Solemya velum]